MARHVVLGKGPAGSAVARLLADRGEDVVVVSRTGPTQSVTAPEGVRHRRADAADPAELAAAAEGAVALYNCANPPYHRWASDWPPVAEALLGAAERSGAILVTLSNLYGYGRVDAPMTEDTPLDATGTKGRVRADMWRQALAAHEAGRVRATEARASDFVGPGVTDGGHLGERVVPRLLGGKAVRVIGDPGVEHSWTAIHDVARTLVALAADERAWGRAWHVPTAPPVSARDAVHRMCSLAGVAPVAVKPLPPLALRVGGVVVPMLREMQEVRHQFEGPFVLDSRAAEVELELEPTPLEATLAATVAWWQERDSVAAS